MWIEPTLLLTGMILAGVMGKTFSLFYISVASVFICIVLYFSLFMNDLQKLLKFMREQQSHVLDDDVVDENSILMEVDFELRTKRELIDL